MLRCAGRSLLGATRGLSKTSHGLVVCRSLSSTSGGSSESDRNRLGKQPWKKKHSFSHFYEVIRHNEANERHKHEQQTNATGPKVVRIEQPFKVTLGGELPFVDIAYEESGPSDAPPERTIMVMPALSAGSHVTSNVDDPEPGWWQEVINSSDAAAIDTRKYRVICAAVLGGPFGTTGPLSADPRPSSSNRWYGPRFPQVTPRDLARVHALLLDHLGIPRVHAAIGASLGGMQVLQFAAEFPTRVNRIVAISATGMTTPGTVALRAIQRRAVTSDAHYYHGDYQPGEGPHTGMMLARMLGTYTYRSRDEFNERFVWKVDDTHTFEVERYLEAQSRNFSRSYDANCYLLLSKCMDLQDLGVVSKTYREGVARIQAKSLIMGVDRDMLVPPSEQLSLYHTLRECGVDAYCDIMPSLYGHDAFLKEHAYLNERIKPFLESA